MDTLKDFLTELKNRISNPLISSFAISWLFINYKVPLAILFYKQDKLGRSGFDTFVDVINENFSTYHMLCLPFYIALAYTFIFPIAKGLIRWFDSFVISYIDTRIIKGTNQHSVKVEAHLAAINDIESYKKVYKEQIEKQNEHISKNTELTIEIGDLKERVANLQSELILANTQLEKYTSQSAQELRIFADKTIRDFEELKTEIYTQRGLLEVTTSELKNEHAETYEQESIDRISNNYKTMLSRLFHITQLNW